MKKHEVIEMINNSENTVRLFIRQQTKCITIGNKVIITMYRVMDGLDIGLTKNNLEKKGKELLVYLSNPYLKNKNGVITKKYLENNGVKVIGVRELANLLKEKAEQ